MANLPFHSFTMDTGNQPGVTYAGMSPELQQEATAIARKKAIAEAIMGQGVSPIQQQTTPQGRVVPIGIAPMLASIIQAVGGAGMMKHQDEASKGLADKSKAEVAQAMQAFNTRLSGSPANEPNDGMGPTRPPIPADPKGAISDAMMSQQPIMMHMAEKAQAAEVAKAQHAADAATRTSDKQEALATRTSDQKAHDERNAELRRELAASQHGRATVATIADPNDPKKTILVDANTGNKIGDGPKLSQTGTADQKLELSKPQAEVRVKSISQNMDRLEAAMQSLHDDKGLSNITGTVMGRTPNLTNKATGAQSQINSIKSQIFQESLQAMREASKTGGAVGNVSDKEGDKLERTIASLDQSQSTDDFKKNLKKAIDQVKLSRDIIQGAFNDQYFGINSRGEQAVEGWTPEKQKRLDELRNKRGAK